MRPRLRASLLRLGWPLGFGHTRGGLLAFRFSRHSEQLTNGVRHFAAFADDAPHILFRNAQLDADTVPASTFAYLHFFRMVYKGFGDEFNQCFHNYFPNPPPQYWRGAKGGGI